LKTCFLLIKAGTCRQGASAVQFEFATAGQIVFGWGRANELGVRTKGLGSRALMLTGARQERTARQQQLLTLAGVSLELFSVGSEPTISIVQAGVRLARQCGAEWIIGIGGGSVIDAAKAIAALTPNPGDVLQYLEVVGAGQAMPNAALPCVAVPTTAGTGSEVTKNAVLHAQDHGVKVSMRGLHLLPRLAIVDPELTVSVPPDVTAATGLDALTQVIEPFVSNARGPLTDALCLEGMRRGARSIRTAVTNGEDRAAREDMALGSLFGGLALANARLGAVHGFAAPLGGLTGAPHGAICARLLPLVMRANLKVAHDTRHAELIERFTQIARAVTDNETALAADSLTWLDALVEDLHIPRLASFGLSSDHVDQLVQQAQHASSMRGNPFELPRHALASILHDAM
jgi:alcohol dehydrogenase class IV